MGRVVNVPPLLRPCYPWTLTSPALRPQRTATASSTLSATLRLRRSFLALACKEPWGQCAMPSAHPSPKHPGQTARVTWAMLSRKG